MRVVVGAAIVRGGRVLAALREDPRGWELPGGKVEPGESDEQALVREIAEELGVGVEVTGWLGGEVPISADLVLRVALARADGEPAASEHVSLQWLDAAGLDDVEWLPADRPFLPQLRAVLGGILTRVRRAILFEEEAAGAVARRLLADGFAARVERERLAGEDDDEDHPWAVVSDAPPFMLEMLVDEHDGWLDEEPHPAPRTAPLDLPTAPRRLKRDP